MKIEIKNRWSDEVIHSGEFESVYRCMADALKMKVSMRDANLRGADLYDADLYGADLRGANLYDADLRDADLRGANLCGANLCDADLRDADLRGANLSGADLYDADLRDANLRGADLRGADLRGADLRDADLRGANLYGADLRGADLYGADLEPVRVDFLAAVLNLPNELEFLRTAIAEGRINGSSYGGECACLAGTLAHAKGIKDYDGGQIKNGRIFVADSGSPRERFFLAIKKGDTPENNGASALALAWTDEAIAIRDNIRAGGLPLNAPEATYPEHHETK